MNGQPTATLVNEHHAGDLSIFTVDVSGSGRWTLINHADGIDLLTSPSGRIIDILNAPWPDTDPQVAAIQAWVERYF